MRAFNQVRDIEDAGRAEGQPGGIVEHHFGRRAVLGGEPLFAGAGDRRDRATGIDATNAEEAGV